MKGTITLRGNTAAGRFEQKVEVSPAAADASHEALASLWARAKVADLLGRDPAALQSGTFPEPLKEAVAGIGVEYRLMTPFTSFVAVEEKAVTQGGKPTKVFVPVELPDGMRPEGATGEGGAAAAMTDGAGGPPDGRPGRVPNVGLGSNPFENAHQSTAGAAPPHDWVAPSIQGGGTGAGDGESPGPLAQFGTPGGGGIGPRGPVFGHGGNVTRIVFVCDASGAMAGKLAALEAQLTRAIGNLKPIQSLNVIFARDGKAVCLSEKASLQATAENRKAALKFIDGIEAQGKSDPTAALEAAFALHPQIVYLLSDGGFADPAAVEKKCLELNPGMKVKINTIAFAGAGGRADERTAEVLQNIAVATGGKYTLVKEEPEK